MEKWFLSAPHQNRYEILLFDWGGVIFTENLLKKCWQTTRSKHAKATDATMQATMKEGDDARVDLNYFKLSFPVIR